MNKKAARLRRAKRARARISKSDILRLCVHRSSQHIYAQVISPDGKVIVSASTLEKERRAEQPNGSNIEAAKRIGEEIAKRCSEKGITQVAFDRSGFKYHGRIKALADAARVNGLQI